MFRNLTKAYHMLKYNPTKRLVKINDIVYYPDKKIDYIFEIHITKITLKTNNGTSELLYTGEFYNAYGDVERTFEFNNHEFGRKVFKSRKKAQANLNNKTGGILSCS